MPEDKGNISIIAFGIGAIFGGLIAGLLVYTIMQKSNTQQSLYPALTPDILQSQTVKSEVLPVQPEILPVQMPHFVAGDIEKTYKNNEKWQIERGPDGRIKSLNVIRDAKVN